MGVFSSVLACAGSGASSGSSSSDGAPVSATRAVDPRAVPTAEIIRSQGEPSATGLEIDDNCVTGRLPGRSGTGQIAGQGVDLVVDADSIQTFSQAVATTAVVVCRPGVGQTEVVNLVATLNGIPGIRVRDFSWPGR